MIFEEVDDFFRFRSRGAQVDVGENDRFVPGFFHFLFCLLLDLPLQIFLFHITGM
jgi:hypothetical protein